LEGVAESGRYLSGRLTAMVGELGLSHERGWGLLRALDLGAEIAPAVVAYARDALEKHSGWENQGLVLTAAGPGPHPPPPLIRLSPPLNVPRVEIDRMLAGLRLAIEAVR